MRLHSSLVHLRDIRRAAEDPSCDPLLSAYRTERPSDCWSPDACDVHGEKRTSLNWCRDGVPRRLDGNRLGFRESRQTFFIPVYSPFTCTQESWLLRECQTAT